MIRLEFFQQSVCFFLSLVFYFAVAKSPWKWKFASLLEVQSFVYVKWTDADDCS